ncbi:MAG: DUF1844 domain-containing protein [Acidobacteria bacterium]|nr:MAG: DUF1844 domain-containing protein [Acidobacteriota bacterium]
MSKEEEEDTGFRVTDRRHFRETGELREDAPAEPQPKKERETPPRAAEPPPGTSPPRIDFPSYLISYYSQALLFLGEVPNPVTKVVEQDLEGVRHTVDILEMIQEKTKGNLSSEEVQLLDSVLYEIRMKFMAKTRKIKL